MYEKYFGLSGRPFQLSPDPRFFYESQGHKRAMSYLRYGLAQGDGFIVITGQAGTGKTTLVKSLFEELDSSNIVAAQLVTTNLNADETLRIVAASFGLAHEGVSKTVVLKNLETFFYARAREGKRILLIVDEAQNLPLASLEELRMLSNFQIGGKVLFQCFLLGQEGFRKSLQSKKLEQFRQRVIAAHHLEPLELEETRHYIEHRLHLVGWTDRPGFSEEAYASIYENSGGIPRRINTFCDRLLLFAYLEELDQLDLSQVKEVADELENENPEFVDPPEEPIQIQTPTVQAVEPQRLNSVGSGLEVRVSILEERLDVLERALRRQLGH